MAHLPAECPQSDGGRRPDHRVRVAAVRENLSWIPGYTSNVRIKIYFNGPVRLTGLLISHGSGRVSSGRRLLIVGPLSDTIPG